MSENALVLRPARWLVLVAGLGASLATGAGLFRTAELGQSPWQIMASASLLLCSIVGFIHFLWFYYLELDDGSIRQVKYFGLFDRTISVSKLTHVGPDTEINVFGARIPSVEIVYPDGKIVLSTAMYPVTGLIEFVSRLADLGTPLHPGLLPALLDLRRASTRRARKSR